MKINFSRWPPRQSTPWLHRCLHSAQGAATKRN